MASVEEFAHERYKATGRLTAAGPNVDPILMLTVIAAVLIGGTAFTGGEGSLLGTIIGVMFLGVIQNGLSLSGVSTFWQGTVSGLILIVAVGLGGLRDYGWKLRLLRARAPRQATDEPEGLPQPQSGGRSPESRMLMAFGALYSSSVSAQSSRP